jgi:hypothetical protein
LTEQNGDLLVRMAASDAQSAGVIPLIRQSKLRILILSVVLVIPCVWHRRIEAGDLPSHVYNAWLAQLIEKGQAPGVYIAKQWSNILFDVLLLRAANVVGIAAAEKIVVSFCVLVFFWGVFAFIRMIAERPPWFLAPCIAMLAYGYSFSMGFMNYYLSLGLACFGLAILWRGRGIAWIAGALLAALAWLAHPIGFLWIVGTLAYVKIRAKLPGWWKLTLPLAAVIAFAAVRLYAAHRPAWMADWDRGPFYLYNGADQLGLYGKRYFFLAAAAFLFGVVCVAADFYARRREGSSWKPFELPFELYVVAFCATALLPENLRPSIYGGWIGLLGSRLTTVSAILGLCFLGGLKPRRWHLAGFGVCAVVFLAFLYQDTGWLNRLEANAEQLVSDLPPGTRVIATIWAPPGSRINFIAHTVERACIGHCFNYANYEPASGEFRVRVRKGSPVATFSSDDAQDMAWGEYEVDETDIPMKQVYQCDAGDLAKLCIRELKEGEANGRIGYKPASAHRFSFEWRVLASRKAWDSMASSERTLQEADWKSCISAGRRGLPDGPAIAIWRTRVDRYDAAAADHAFFLDFGAAGRAGRLPGVRSCRTQREDLRVVWDGAEPADAPRGHHRDLFTAFAGVRRLRGPRPGHPRDCREL